MVINGHRVSFGTDFEVFIRQVGTDQFIPARLVTSGTKDAYEPIKGGSIHADGLAVELGIDPAYTAAGFVAGVQRVLEELTRRCEANGWYISQESVIEFTPEQWASFTPDEIEVGCNPDFNIYHNPEGGRFKDYNKDRITSAYQLAKNPSPVDKLGTKRTVGGHLHIGWTQGKDVVLDNFHQLLCKGVVRKMDSVFCSHHKNTPLGLDAIGCQDRVAFYGGFGCYRPKAYGVEYRAPDSRWLLDAVKCRAVMDNVQTVLQAAGKDGSLLAMWNMGGLKYAAA